MFCCGKNRDSNFCPECGAAMCPDEIKRKIVLYFDRQAKTVAKNYETRKKHNQGWAEKSKKSFEDKIKKWEEWRDWVLSKE